MPVTLGPLQRGELDSKEFAFYGFAGGLNVKSPPQLVADNDLTIATDGYLQPSGAFQMRNGMSKNGTTLGSTGPTILARFYQDVKNGAVVSPEVTILLAQNGGNLYNYGTGALIGSIGGSTASAMTYVRMQDPNDPNTGFTAGLTDVIVICTGVGGPYVYDGTNLYVPVGWSQASGASWCAIVNGIVWFGGIKKFPNQIFGSGDGIIASMETLPAYRNFALSALVTGLLAQGTGATATLVIGRSLGISVLYGTGPSTFFLQDIPYQDGGVTAGRTMISESGVGYWLGRAGIYSFDGQTVPRRISDKIEPWIFNDPLVTGYPMTGFRNLSWSCIYDNRLHIGYCALGQTQPNAILVFDLVMQAWTGPLLPTPGLASMILLDAPSDPSPYNAVVGSSTSGQAYNWDYLPSTTTMPATDDGVPILASCLSKYFSLGVPGSTKALQRFYPEMYVAGAFNANIVVGFDAGNTTTQRTSNAQGLGGTNTLVWNVGSWDVSNWAGATGFTRFGPPASRIDFPGNQADTFAFGVSMYVPLAPWIFIGGTGVVQQRGRT
jgi:hypothetical protein